MYVQITPDGNCGCTCLGDPAGLYPEEIVWHPVPEALAPWLTSDYVADGDSIAPPSLAYLVDQLTVRVEERYRSVRDAGVLVDGHRYRTDRDGRGDLANMIQAAKAEEETAGAGTFGIPWECPDGSIAPLDLAGLTAAGLAASRHVVAAKARQQAINAAIAAAAAAEGATWADVLKAYTDTIDTGWPG